MWLPDRPDHPFYKELVQHIENSPLLVGAIDFRYWCEKDFWFFMRNAMSAGGVVCGDYRNKHFGKRWFDHPWLFERCRDVRENPNGRLFKWPRGHFKTAIITTGLTLHDFIRDLPRSSNLRVLILTYKLDTTGEAFIGGIKRECETNEKLKFHWPDLFWSDPQNQAQPWTKNALIFKRAGVGGGAKEPSILVSSLDKQPTSQHFDVIVMDDAVTRETVTSEEQVKKTFSAMQQSTFLGSDVTQRRYIGTNWANDDPWHRGERDKMFTVDHLSCYDEAGNGVLRSKGYLEEWERSAGRYNFSAQMLGRPTSSSDKVFMLDWWQDYGNEPTVERDDKNVYTFVDVAKSLDEDADYTVIATIGLGDDNNYYLLDLRRDRWSTEEFKDQVLEACRKWRPLTCYVEQFGAMRDVDMLREEMRRRKWRGTRIEALPRERGADSGRDKAYRILRLQESMSRYRWWFPKAVGYRPKGDGRDCLQIFFEEEYKQWSPVPRAIPHDDMLDTLAMALNTELRLHWPVNARSPRTGRRKRVGKVNHNLVSSWVA